MRYWIDPDTGSKLCEPNCAVEWLQLVYQIGFDYDGYSSANDLKSLIDELVEMTLTARKLIQDGIIFPEDTIEKKEKEPECMGG